MKTFYLTTADDKSRHLYVWDSALKTMELVISAVQVYKLNYGIYVIEDLQSKFKVVALYNSVIHEFEVPTKDVKLICRRCIWNVGDSFYGYDPAVGKIRLLGAYKQFSVSIRTLCSLEETSDCYFVQNNDDGTQKLIFIREEGIVDVGNYVKIESTTQDYVFAFRDEVYCDVYKPISPYVCKPTKGRISSFGTNYAFYWQGAEECWACLGLGRLLASNAFQTYYIKDNRQYAILYRLKGLEKELVTEGKWHYRDSDDVATCINGIEYRFKDPKADNKVVDFDNPKPVPKKFLKLF
ncbi:MAG: hypothetical protein E7012_03875 [Alphaproteobacteria bacterium]|nr:hypothetical protein [Alphaproteobacteria bacterium]